VGINREGPRTILESCATIVEYDDDHTKKYFLLKLAEITALNRLNTVHSLSGGFVNDIRDVFLTLRLQLARVASRIVPPHEVEDIVQETYVRLCHVGKADSIQHAKSYLYRTVHNLALDHVKRAENRLRNNHEDGEDGAIDDYGSEVDETFEQVATGEEFDQFCEAVRLLPVQARRVFVLKKVYGYSQREIAAELGLAESTVEKHVALAMRRCAEHMKGLELSSDTVVSRRRSHEEAKS